MEDPNATYAAEYAPPPPDTSTNSAYNAAPPPAPPPPPPEALRARHRYVHLFMPLIMAALVLKNGSIVSRIINPNQQHPQYTILLVAATALPTYLFGSFFYPANRPAPTPEESIRFTRKRAIYRALVLASYGRIYGTPFNLQFYFMDLLYSYLADTVIGERPVGTPQRRSEFLAALPWVCGSGVAWSLVPPRMSTLNYILGAADRTFWRAAYIALVDDVVKVLARPDVRTLKGKVILVCVQAFTITSLVGVALAWAKRNSEATAYGMGKL